MRRLLACIFSLFLLPCAFAQKSDVGGELGTNLTFLQVSQKAALDPPVSAGVTASSLTMALAPSAYFNAQSAKGTYFRFNLGLSLSPSFDIVNKVWSSGIPHLASIFDLKELAVGTKTAIADTDYSSFAINFGRFFYNDPTSTLFAGTLDGLSLGITYPFMNMDILLGYTGLLWSTSSTINMSVADSLSTSIVGSPRAIMGAGFRFSLFEQAFFVNFLAQEDLRAKADLISEYSTELDATKGGPVDTQYISLGASGLIAGKVSYTTFGVLETGRVLSYMDDITSPSSGRYLAAPVLAAAFGVEAGFTLMPGLNGGVGLEYGTGDADSSYYIDGNTAGKATQFTAITSRTVGLVFSPQLGNSTHVKVAVDWKPFMRENLGLKSVQASSNTFVFMKSGDGPMSVPGVNAGVANVQDSGFVGIEQDLSASLRMLSDLSLNGSLGFFLPATAPAGAFDTGYDGTGLQFLIRIACTVFF